MKYIEPDALEARQVIDLLTDLLKRARNARHKAQTDRARAGYWHGAAFGFEQAAAQLAEYSRAQASHGDEKPDNHHGLT